MTLISTCCRIFFGLSYKYLTQATGSNRTWCRGSSRGAPYLPLITFLTLIAVFPSTLAQRGEGRRGHHLCPPHHQQQTQSKCPGVVGSLSSGFFPQSIK